MDTNTQPSFAEHEEHLRLERLSARNKLAALDKVVNWENFRPTLNKALRKTEPKGPGGRPAFDPVMKFKLLVLQSLYNLSDGELEFQVEDRATFRAFAGLGADDVVPDEKTIWEFRNRLVEANVMKKLFDRFESILSEKNLYVNDGRIVDAEIVEVPRRRVKPDTEEHKDSEPEENAKEHRRRENRKRQVDTDAQYTKKHNKTYFGYKNTVKIDNGSKLILDYATCSANRHDSAVFDEVMNEEQDADQDVFADKGYAGQGCLTTVIRKAGVGKSRILNKAYRDKPITDEQKAENKQWAKIRARVEHVFAHKKYVMNQRLIRSIGIERADFQIGLSNLVYNMQRLVFLERARG